VKYAPHIAVAVVILIAGLLLWLKFKPVAEEPIPPPPPTAGAVPIDVKPNVTHGDPSLPKPDEHTTGVLRIAISDTNAPGKIRTIFVYIPEDPETPPQVRSEIPVQAQFAPVVDPWFMLQKRLMLGGSLSDEGDVSPWVGVGDIQLFRRIDLGAGADEDGIGVFVAYHVWRDFDIGAMYYILPLFESDARACLFIAYRF
jgi:hypothetical protein